MATQSIPTCIYCGKNESRVSDEHIIPKTIGGYESIRPVCQSCNSGVLSKIDNELCSHSPITFIASEEFGDQRVIPEIWMIEERQNKLLVEGQWDPIASVHRAYPQLIIEGDNAQLRADGDEIKLIGFENFQTRFIEAAKHAYDHYQKCANRKKRLFFEPVDRRFFPEDNRLPPRIFTRHKLTELKKGDSFVLRYVDDEDKRHLLNKLSKGALFKGAKRKDFFEGDKTLAFQFMYTPATIGRAFLKIGINALRWTCENTEVARGSFPEAFHLITGEKIDDRKVESSCGFVNANDLISMGCQKGEHRIWIMREADRWCVKTALFGGRIGGIATFDGPSNESWNFAEIVCPFNAPQKLVNKSSLFVAGKLPVQTRLFSEIAPSLKTFNARQGQFLAKRKTK